MLCCNNFTRLTSIFHAHRGCKLDTAIAAVVERKKKIEKAKLDTNNFWKEWSKAEEEAYISVLKLESKEADKNIKSAR